ncbi:EamA family transporter [Pontibacillus salicampi]|uniref:EamA family transporter n=1 Tax=Pontibacillus salicampi TaxID=1449801 RepID=A0ABV6LI77_9BACI
MKDKTGALWILFAAMLWGTTGTAQELAPDQTHPIAVGAARLAVGGISMLVIALLMGRVNWKQWPKKPTAIAALSMAAYQPLFFSAVTITGVAVGTVVAIGSAPVLSGAIEWMFARKRPSPVWWCSTFVSILGCMLLFMNTQSVSVDPNGIVMALGAGLSFAVYTFASRELTSTHHPTMLVAVVFTLSAFLLSPFVFVLDMEWILTGRGMLVSLHLGMIATGAAYLLFAIGLRHVASSTAVTLSLAEPLTAALLGVFLLGEILNLTSWIGVILMVGGIGLLVFMTKRSKSNQQSRLKKHQSVF